MQHPQLHFVIAKPPVDHCSRNFAHRVSGSDLVGELASQLSTAKLTERCDECKKDEGTQHPPVTLWQACATVQDNLSKESLSHGHVWAGASRTKRETQHNNERKHGRDMVHGQNESETSEGT